MRVSVVVGNPKPRSRTLEVAESVAHLVATESATLATVDLAEYATRLFAWPDESLEEICSEVASSNLVVFASPTYKASFTGMLKAFLDRYGHRALAGVFVVPVMTMATESHSLAADSQLRPVLVELGAIIPTSSVAFPISALDRVIDFLDDWAGQNQSAISLIRSALMEQDVQHGGVR